MSESHGGSENTYLPYVMKDIIEAKKKTGLIFQKKMPANYMIFSATITIEKHDNLALMIKS